LKKKRKAFEKKESDYDTRELAAIEKRKREKKEWEKVFELVKKGNYSAENLYVIISIIVIMYM
jgi:hypothetical protein